MKYVKSKASLKPRRRTLWAGLVVVLILAVAAGGYLKFHHKNTAQIAAVAANSGTTSTKINYNPPTAQDKAAAEQNKDNIVSQSTNQPAPTTSDGRISVQPVITNANKSTINAYVTGVFEDGGTCTATLTQGSQTITRTSAGFENASYTQCAPISLSDANLGSGTWSVVVSYSSAAASGTSSSKTLAQ